MAIFIQRSTVWARRALGALLGIVAVYLLGIDQLSPHHLPGLRWFAFCVLAAGPTAAFAATRFRRVEAASAVAAVLFGLIALGDVATTGRHAAPRAATTGHAPARATPTPS